MKSYGKQYYGDTTSHYQFFGPGQVFKPRPLVQSVEKDDSPVKPGTLVRSKYDVSELLIFPDRGIRDRTKWSRLYWFLYQADLFASCILGKQKRTGDNGPVGELHVVLKRKPFAQLLCTFHGSKQNLAKKLIK
jgi:hypothetical protein